MAMPFLVEEFFAVFARYNAATWPLHVLAIAMGLAISLLALRRRGAPARLVLTVLAAFWLVNAVGYHWLYFAVINPVARVFAAGFLLQATLLLRAAIRSPDLRLSFRGAPRAVIGGSLCAFALVLYPVWGWLAGHAWPAVPAFGVAPCPTTIFTIGMLFGGDWRRVSHLLVVPALWAVIGGSAAILLRVPQDFALLAAAALVAGTGLAMALRRRV